MSLANQGDEELTN
jgi:hypothetical protein